MTSEILAELGPDVVIGSYRIVKEIGRGGMGTVFEAVHALLPRRAAIKIMHADLRRHPGMATRMVQEAAILEQVRHPGVARVFECSLLPDRRPWIAMELVEGETLAGRLHYATRLAPVEVATLLAELGDVLAAVHAHGVVHRDLKPDNLLLTPGDRAFPLRVVDWGVARLGAIGRMTLDGMTPGTPLYMSPEQASGRPIGPPCDVYSLGVIAYEALVGHPPFDGRTLAEVVCMHLTSEPEPLADRCGAPAELCRLVHRMLEKDPALRPGAVELRQLARALAIELAAVSTPAPEPAPPEPAYARPAAHARSARMEPATDEVVIVDPEALELGATEMLPVMRKPRWTPEIGPLPRAAAELSRGRTITPRAPRDQVAGEIVVAPRRRS